MQRKLRGEERSKAMQRMKEINYRHIRISDKGTFGRIVHWEEMAQTVHWWRAPVTAPLESLSFKQTLSGYLDGV